MKYGLPRDEKPRKRWKTRIENELNCLKMEVCFLKSQLDEATKKLKESSSKPLAPSTLNLGKNFHYQPTWAYDKTISRAVQIHSITCMDCYEDGISFEELRHKDYALKGVGCFNQFQRFKDSQLRFSRTERNHFPFTQKTCKSSDRKCQGEDANLTSSFIIPWYQSPSPPKAAWPFGPSTRSNGMSKSPPADNIAPSSSDTRTESKTVNQHDYVSTSHKKTTKCVADVGISTDNDTSSQVLSELKKMGEKMSSVDDRLSKMDTSLSDISSRVSIMDSRLSAIDIHFTLQRFDKKWQGLETRLSNLETPQAISSLVDKSDNNISCVVIREEGNNEETEGNIVSLSVDKEINKNQQTEFKMSGVGLKAPLQSEVEPLPAVDSSDVNLTDFVRSISANYYGSRSLCASSISDNSFSNDSLSKKTIEIASIEMADLKPFTLPPMEPSLVGNSNLKENNFPVNDSELQPTPEKVSKKSEGITKNSDKKLTSNKVIFSNELEVESEESLEVKKLVQQPELEIDSLVRAGYDGAVLHDPLGVTEQNMLKTHVQYDHEDDDFVIVEKYDVEEPMNENLTTNIVSSLSKEATSSCELKIRDMTEYLEINLGKKKNLDYKFGFEAKADRLLEPEENSGHEIKSDGTAHTKAENTSDEDSFQHFKINFMGNKSVEAKQSSPFVFYGVKTQTESPVKNNMEKRKIRKSVLRKKVKDCVD